MEGAPAFKQHYFYLKCAADRFAVPATLDITTSIVKLSYPDNTAHLLYPQFSKTRDTGSRFYHALLEKESDRFAGWRPYLPIFIDGFNDKLYFKQYLLAAGCLTPDYSESTTADLVGVIIKNRQSAFSENIKGPFAAASECPLHPEQGEYYEQFIAGEIVKIWYGNAKPICIELASMPAVLGDGQQSIGELIIALSASKGYENPQDRLLKQLIRDQAAYKDDPRYEGARVTLNRIQQVLLYSGYTLDDVLDKQQRQIIDFRYVHRFPRNNAVHWLDRCELDVTPYRDQLEYTGAVIATLLEQPSCSLLFYTVDAILDDSQQLWILEANSNPMMHPFVYEDMLHYLSQSKL